MSSTVPRQTAKLQCVRLRDGAVAELASRSAAASPDRQVDLHLIPTGETDARFFAAEIRFPPDGLVDVVWRVQLADGSERFFELPRVGPAQCRASNVNTGVRAARFRFTVRLTVRR